MSYLFPIDKLYCIVFKKQLLAVTQKTSGSENSEEMFMVKCSFSSTTSSRLKACYPAIKEMFPTLVLSLLSDNPTVFTSIKP